MFLKRQPPLESNSYLDFLVFFSPLPNLLILNSKHHFVPASPSYLPPISLALFLSISLFLAFSPHREILCNTLSLFLGEKLRRRKTGTMCKWRIDIDVNRNVKLGMSGQRFRAKKKVKLIEGGEKNHLSMVQRNWFCTEQPLKDILIFLMNL